MGKGLGRNAPCHCGSGKKYKHCCIDKDRERRRLETMEKKQQGITNLSYEFNENFKGEVDLDPKRVRQNKPFSTCRREFEEYVEGEDLHEIDIFDHFNSLGKNARDYDEHNYVIETIYWIRSKEQEIFKSLSGLLLKYTIASAICNNRVDLLPELISWLDPTEHIGEFLRTVEMLFYFGDLDALETLKRVFTEKADRVRESSSITVIGEDLYFIRLRELVTAIEYSKSSPLDGKRLYEQLKPYIASHIQVGDVEEYILSPINKGQEKAEEILTKIYRENNDDNDLLMPLRYSMAGALTKTYDIPIAKALLAAEHLEDFFYSRTIEDESIASIIIPNEKDLSYFFRKYAGILFADFWKVASMMTILPYYTDLLQGVTIIIPKEAEDLKEYLSKVLPGVLSALVDYSQRGGVINTLLAADLDRLYRETYLLKGG